MNEQIKKRVDQLRLNYTEVTQGYFNHFFCPILRADVSDVLCKGHVIPESANGSAKWVPQVEWVDNTFGALFESRLGLLSDRDRPLHEIVSNDALRRVWKPQLHHQGSPVPYYPTKGVKRVPGQTPLIVEGPNGGLCNFNVKFDESSFTSDSLKTIDFVLNYDIRAEVAAASLKAAHLTMFYLLRYHYAFSPAGEFAAGLLNEMLQDYVGGTGRDEVLSSFFAKFPMIVRPSTFEDSFQASTLNSGMVLCCISASGNWFAMAINVTLGDDTTCVFLPCDSNEIDTYFSFLQSPPESISVRECHLRFKDVPSPFWETPIGDPVRISIRPE